MWIRGAAGSPTAVPSRELRDLSALDIAIYLPRHDLAENNI